MYGLLGGLLERLLLCMLLTVFFTLQYVDTGLRQYALDYWGWVAVGYTGLHALHFLLTTRDG